MEEYTTCRDAILELIDEGSKLYGNAYRISESMQSRIDDVCDGIDALVSEVECESVDADIRDLTKTLRIIVVCDELVLHGGRTNAFFNLITKLDSFSFSKQGREFLRIELSIENVWELVCE